MAPRTREEACVASVEKWLDAGRRDRALATIDRLLLSEEDRLVRLRMTMKRNAIVLVGTQAPDFSAATPTGDEIRLSSYRGRFVLLHFWATWSLPAAFEIPHWRAIARRHAGPNFAMLGVSLDYRNDREFLAHRMRLKGMDWPTVFLGSDFVNRVAMLYKVSVIPYSVLIGPDGKVLETDLLGERLVEAVGRRVGASPAR